MKFVTRERAKVDRIACAWLIKRFVDPGVEILYVPATEVMATAQREDAVPFDVPGVELGHHGDQCSFDAFVEKYRPDDHALRELAKIVRGADTETRNLTPESPGLFAAASGFHALVPHRFKNDLELLETEMPLYDAFYEYCKQRAEPTA